jgi:lipopolysaccharide transport system permease protein
MNSTNQPGSQSSELQKWEWEIKPQRRWINLNLKDIVQYKDLLFRFVRRDIIASYQQTILGPVWVFLQPLLTTLVYFIVFRKIAGISTSGIPPILFYLPGIIIWTYFSDCLTGIMYTFLHNAQLFNKIYFPRLIVPLSTILFNSFRLAIQFMLFILIYVFFLLKGEELETGFPLLILPVLILMTAGFAFGLGLIISVYISKYRDIDNILQFLIRLFMFATPVVYPASAFPEKLKFIIWLNPLTSVLETFRAAFFSHEPIMFGPLIWSFLFICMLVLVGLSLFRYHEATIMDVV